MTKGQWSGRAAESTGEWGVAGAVSVYPVCQAVTEEVAAETSH